MDMVSSCRDKLSYFRIKELKDVLTQLGLAKQGKKQDLVDRILALLSDEQVPKSHGWGKRNTIGRDGVAKIIDDTYRKMQVPSSTESASKSHSGSDLNYVKPKEEFDDSKFDMKTRCLCGSTLVTDSMIQLSYLAFFKNASVDKGLKNSMLLIKRKWLADIARKAKADMAGKKDPLKA